MKKYLPLGSVVLLKGAEKKLIIIGRCQVCENKVYDYSGCLFPEGYLGKEQMYVFNNEDIELVYYMGMQNEEEFAFRKALAEADEKVVERLQEEES